MTPRQMEFEEYIQSKDFFEYSTPASPKFKGSQTMEPDMPRTSVSTAAYLVAFSTRSQSFCVGNVDIVNSTKISASLPAEKLSQYYEIFLNSMSKIIGKFGGRVIKNIGDCLLYYFPTSENSPKVGLTNCLDCGLAMVSAQRVLSEEMNLKRLPDIKYRVSSDFGAVIMMNTNFSTSVDLIGPPVNMCAKINHYAGNNEFVIGNDLHQVTKKFCEYHFKEIQSCDIGFRYSYPIYKVTSNR